MLNKEIIEFIEQNKTQLIRFGAKHVKSLSESEDCLQKFMLTLSQREITGVENIKPFVMQCLMNQYRNHVRTKKRYVSLFDIAYENIPLDNQHIVDEDYDDRIVKIREFMAKLPEKQREAILRRINDEDRPEGVNYDTDKANFRWGILKLRKMYEDETKRSGKAR